MFFLGIPTMDVGVFPALFKLLCGVLFCPNGFCLVCFYQLVNFSFGFNFS